MKYHWLQKIPLPQRINDDTSAQTIHKAPVWSNIPRWLHDGAPNHGSYPPQRSARSAPRLERTWARGYLDFPEIRGIPLLFTTNLGAQNSCEVAIIWPDIMQPKTLKQTSWRSSVSGSIWSEWAEPGGWPLKDLQDLLVFYIGVSKNNGTPKSSILIGFSIIFTIHFGVPLLLETSICFYQIWYPYLDTLISFMSSEKSLCSEDLPEILYCTLPETITASSHLEMDDGNCWM